MRDTVHEIVTAVVVSGVLGIGAVALDNQKDVAVLQNQESNDLAVQKELVAEVKELKRVVYKIDARLDAGCLIDCKGDNDG